MTRRIYIAMIAMLALLINSVCLCAAVVPSCAAASCAAHAHQRACPEHQHHQDSPGGHECCHMAACGGPTAIRNATDFHAGNHLAAPLLTIVRAPILDAADMAARLLTTRQAHSPPPAVPVFLAIRSLLL
jgi:hypothetical protein